MLACLVARRASSTLVPNNLIDRLKYYVLQLGDPYPYPYPLPYPQALPLPLPYLQEGDGCGDAPAADASPERARGAKRGRRLPSLNVKTSARAEDSVGSQEV